jgi:putative acetyltransferase
MSLEDLIIRESMDSDLMDILEVEKQAFGTIEEAQLVNDLLHDESANPVLSLLAFAGEASVGHILFTRSIITGNEDSVLTHILAPLAVKPEYQSKGIGRKLVEEGLILLNQMGTKLVFVLGYPEYYSKFGFIPNAEKLGFIPPYPILAENSDAWMVKPLTDYALSKFQGKVVCAGTMDKPEYWRE